MEIKKKVLDIDPKRVVALKQILDGDQQNGTMVVLFDYIYELLMPKVEIPHNEDGSFKFKVYDIDFNKDIHIEKLLKK